jgi:hypothetical protein
MDIKESVNITERYSKHKEHFEIKCQENRDNYEKNQRGYFDNKKLKW